MLPHSWSGACQKAVTRGLDPAALARTGRGEADQLGGEKMIMYYAAGLAMMQSQAERSLLFFYEFFFSFFLFPGVFFINFPPASVSKWDFIL